MPHYLFSVHDSASSPDSVGIDLPDLPAARAEAIRTAGEIIQDLDGSTGEEWRMEVADESGRAVLTLRFSVTEHAS